MERAGVGGCCGGLARRGTREVVLEEATGSERRWRRAIDVALLISLVESRRAFLRRLSRPVAGSIMEASGM